MPKNDNSPSPLPYSDIAAAVLGAIYDSLHIIYQGRFRGIVEKIVLERLVKRAEKINDEKWAKHQSKNNPHVRPPIRSFERLYDAGLAVPRISRLCLEATDHAYKQPQGPDEETSRGILVPSPLAILVDVLTTPSRPESSGYGFALARAILFSHYKVHPPTSALPSGWASLSISDVQDTIETFKIYLKHRDNIHHSKSNPTKAFVANFLAMMGIFVLRFGTAGKESLKTAKAQADCLGFLNMKQFLARDQSPDFEYEFRIDPGLEDLPDTQEILNSLMGVPVPIAGGATVFFGGLQRSHHDSLVISASGPPGTGKTSFALALAGSLAPFGTQCFYCTFEEDAETLRRRALGLVPEYFRRTTLPNSVETDWLHPFPLVPTAIEGVDDFVRQYISLLKERLAGALSRTSEPPNSLPGIAPLLVVIDGLTALLGRIDGPQLEKFCTFIRELRDLNCIVLLLSAEDIPKSSRLEYLVDTVILLRHEGTGSAMTKPIRLFQLVKSRLQMSRPGSHILHLSGENGLRLAPQLPSQLDSHRIHRIPLPNTAGVIDTLRPEGVPLGLQRPSWQPERLISLFPRSRILVHGHGSSGKAALALKMLAAPSLDIKTGKPLPFAAHKRPRILAVSFLYPREFYDRALKRILRAASRGKSPECNPQMRVLALTPGFIGPEDFINMVLLELDQGHMEGWPYTGLLLDGLHNTFLQFPLLQANPMVWPALFSLLTRYELTVVTTFTVFDMTYSQVGLDRKDAEIYLQGQLPFLHALIQGTDFQLEVEQRLVQHDRTFFIKVKSAIDQRIPSKALVWNADSYTFDRFEPLRASQPELPLTAK
jgi:KaiC/GvpD/RAD55 family RecA-like ATPase